MATKLRGELENSADNQERWLEFEASRPHPQLGSPLIVWEQSLIKGHPTHPVESSSELHGQHQTSMRTISIPDFPFHLKMALSFTITSATRTMTPWTTRMCIEVSGLLEDIVDPELLWIARKRAAACSADPDFERAKHLSVMLREDPEPRASGRGECLVLPAALFEVSSRGGEEEKERVGRAVELFELGSSVEAKREWFRNYTHLYFLSTLPLLLSHGICLESHLQNLLARFDTTTHTLRGFVYRDMGGLRMHKPTLAARGIRVRSADLVPGAVTLIEDLEPAWANAYHCLENHLGGAMRGLGLQWGDGEEGKGGWGVVREELRKVLDGCADPDGKREELWGFLVQPVVKRKAFLRMKVAGVYRGGDIC
ncbi:uncharacterized protein C8A04DRAFT_39228 [Dichotomopilus funicola]|uniref:Uncharacterized protein n=1 Tax=Dichotomopilus funicola TaxID=1934379 RepID=A0AAN6ZL42_9PEZI|nr:hypothetical protein C8A04DRAFT_39228 [Dichotomopilus funicola]